MARSRHGRSGGRPSPDAGLPSWAQRHLDEAGDTASIPASAARSPRRHRRAAVPASGLRGWGVAIVSVAAAVGAVPLAISAVANDHSGDPLPRVDTYTAGKPGPLPSEPGSADGSRSGPGAVSPGDPATSDVLEQPPAPPVAAPPVVPPPPVPVPAAVVAPTPAVVPPVTPRTATTTAPASAVQGRSGTPSTKPTKSSSKPSSKGGSNGGSGGSGGGGNDGGSGGLVGGVLETGGHLVHDTGGAVGGVLGGS